MLVKTDSEGSGVREPRGDLMGGLPGLKYRWVSDHVVSLHVTLSHIIFGTLFLMILDDYNFHKRVH